MSSFYAFEYLAVIISVAGGLNGSPSTSQPKLLSTASTGTLLTWNSDEAFAILELALAFPDLSTTEGQSNRISEFVNYFCIALDTIIAWLRPLSC